MRSWRDLDRCSAFLMACLTFRCEGLQTSGIRPATDLGTWREDVSWRLQRAGNILAMHSATGGAFFMALESSNAK